ncbi:TatD family hydrolase [Shewanella sp. C32]|uniref:TatD family hydrolase n=1 Tax=Shewanella electrica TaxID=515560 RepID=A0ABT2FF66_9GAMM|nr:TatD family hydrolase [Shewanella electrica]MCH1925085.1 TatD family hydrolase [Shewanella electrica]MCS4554909.1 TatD family hydrolase [Shewanella electrica]
MLDSHAHLDFAVFDHDRDALLAQMRQHGISGCILPGVSPAQWPMLRAIANQYHLPFALGIHPWYLPESLDYAITALEQALEQAQHADGAKLVAIGECGLDKLRAKRMAEQGEPQHWTYQLTLFERQLQLAERYQLPLIIHAVQCHGIMLEQLAKYDLPRGGVIHGFSGSVAIAQQYWHSGWRLGIGGLLLNPQAKKLRAVVEQLPLAALLVETDAPDMTPVTSDEPRNTPLTILAVVAEIARLRKLSVVQVTEQLSKNAVQLFDY